MKVLFSLVYPTRDRPKFVATALEFLRHSQASDVQIVICDNPSSEELNVARICRESGVSNITYARAPRNISMVENWNYGMSLTTGSYVGYFTDKMFLLPQTLPAVRALLRTQRPDIINWTDAAFYPETYPNYFGPGIYKLLQYKRQKRDITFAPREELCRRLSAKVTRERMTSREYAVGKICFGLYSRELINSIRELSGEVFLPVSPDYTSMAMGLALARSGAFLNSDGIVHIHTDLSNGGRFEREADHAADFLSNVDPENTRWLHQLIPRLDWSLENNLYSDYLRALKAVKASAKLTSALSDRNWFEHILAKVLEQPVGVGGTVPQPIEQLREFALQRGWDSEIVAPKPKSARSALARLARKTIQTLRQRLRRVLPAAVAAMLMRVVDRSEKKAAGTVKRVVSLAAINEILS